MSLMDALLLDEYRDPKDLWITQRADGMAGVGSATDPADGGVKSGPSLSLSTLSFDLRQVLVYTTSAHGLTAGQTVIIFGAVGPRRGPFFSANLTGGRSFTVTSVLSPNAFTYTLFSDQTPEGPPDSMDRIYCVGSGAEIPARLYWPVAQVTVANHGYVDYEAITVQGATPTAFNGATVAIGVDPAKVTGFFFRLSTLPAPNPTGNPYPVLGTGASCFQRIFRFDKKMHALGSGAIARLGNAPPSNPFLTRGLSSAYVASSVDWDILNVGYTVKPAQNIVGSGIEATTLKITDAADPSTPTMGMGSFKTTSAFQVEGVTIDANMAGQLVPPRNFSPAVANFAPVVMNGVNLYGSNCRIRRVRVVNWGTQSWPECFVLSIGGDTGLSGKVNNVIEGGIIERPAENNYHETTTVYSHGPSGGGGGLQAEVQANGSACVARRNHVNCSYGNGAVSSQYVAVVKIRNPGNDSLAAPDANGRFKVTGTRPLARPIGSAVTVAGIGWNVPNVVCPYNGTFAVVDVDPVAGLWVTCQMLDLQDIQPGMPTAPGSYDMRLARVGADFHGPVAFAGTGGVVEVNGVFDCTNPAYNDTGSTRDVVFRYNYYSDVFYGLHQNFDPGGSDPSPLTSLSRPAPFADPTLVEAIWSATHYLSVGDIVDVSTVLVGGSLANVYNATFAVTDVPSGSTFRFRLPPAPSIPDPDPGSVGKYSVRWQTRRVVMESNLVDLYRVDQYSFSVPTGALTYITPQSDVPREFPGWIVRENVFRHTDGVPADPHNLTVFPPAVRLTSLDGALVEQNLSDLQAAFPFQFLYPQNVRTFNNQTSGGGLLQGEEVAPGIKTYDELSTLIDDVLTMAL